VEGRISSEIRKGGDGGGGGASGRLDFLCVCWERLVFCVRDYEYGYWNSSVLL